MISVRRYGDSGQAFPIYITVVGGLLFLAFAYFAVGQAAVNRNGAQTAADAAALAAAMNTRDELADQWVKDVLDPTKWQEIFDGKVGVPDSCWRATELAAQNDATARCVADGPLSYKVDAETLKSVGDSVVPGTEDMHKTARATAVIDKLCTFTPTGADGVLPELTCRDRTWTLDPTDLTDLPGPEDLFDVHLAD
ncbi:putative Flp pilus-assembly TadE/G-like protein [Streptomyces sp. Ag109_O5-1]|uniref:pilus assembly protein TadG-related protein n=1 Tax=Streptomyces sp. Ag109_O5-1 TaxID=1938851 RepID=UPI000FC39A36|nr:pilus assembly protein TadG-related protein [Streptomyces sp. Ag109_O5-1]RPE41105.1 putative Flp pilus-assembly TadE/G-like protein [Streptomyces sp. Ag109_O5-1]